MGRRLWNLVLFFVLAVLIVFFLRVSSQVVLIEEPPVAYEPFSSEPTPVIPATVPPPSGSGEAAAPFTLVVQAPFKGDKRLVS